MVLFLEPTIEWSPGVCVCGVLPALRMFRERIPVS